jgi:hypothetical protein
MTILAHPQQQACWILRRGDFGRSSLAMCYGIELDCALFCAQCPANSQSETAGVGALRPRYHRFEEALSRSTNHTAMCGSTLPMCGSTLPMCGAARRKEREWLRCDPSLVGFIARMTSCSLGTQVAVAFNTQRSSDDVGFSVTPGLTHWTQQGQ